MTNLQPLILTLKIDDESFAFFDALRRKYFPPQRNFLSAHVTLFHHLPGEKIGEIKADLTRISAATEGFDLRFTDWRFLGKGSAISIESEKLERLKNQLNRLWRKDLTPQDQQKFRPHITVQNKVAPDEARRTFQILSAQDPPPAAVARGLMLWHYEGGPWRFEAEFAFADGA